MGFGPKTDVRAGVIYDATGFPLIVSPNAGIIQVEHFNGWLTTGDTMMQSYDPGTAVWATASPDYAVSNQGVILGTVSAVGDALNYHWGTNRWDAGLATTYYECHIKTSHVSTASEEQLGYFGFGDNHRALGTHTTYGTYFLYDRPNNGDFLSCITDGGTTETEYVLDGGGGRPSAPYVADTYMKLKVVVSGSENEAYYYVNDVLVYTETTDTPTAGTEPMAIVTKIHKTVGSTDRTMTVDYIRQAMVYDTPV